MKEMNTPVLIGCGQTTDKRTPELAGTPVELMADVARKAADDAGAGEALLQAIEVIATVGLVVDSPESGSSTRGMIRNVPDAVSRSLGINPARKFSTYAGGNTPQMLVNKYAQQIASGEASAVLLVGAEALETMVSRLKAKLDMGAWHDGAGGDPEVLGEPRPAASAHEMSYGIHTPSVSYPLFENALRGKYGYSLDQHREQMGKLFQRYNAVAAKNPLSWFPTERTADEISTVSDENRYVGFPYTKYLNSIIRVNMGAAVIMTSVARARELGVSEDRMVYLHGCADANEIWNVTERTNYYSSNAVRTIGEKAFAMSGKSIDDMDFFDIYSCFPSAVQVVCDELGLAHDDPRGLTVTGGLPYFGGPGNNYVMHSIASMMDVLRAHPGKYGLLNGNGWFLTKHSIGIYSTTPVRGDWKRDDPASYQQAILDRAHPPFTETPQGPARIETYTVMYGRRGVERALIVGRLDDGTRFLAHTPADAETLRKMIDQDMLDAAGFVSSGPEGNVFIPEFR